MYIQRNIVLLMTLFMGMLSVIAQNTNSVSGRVIDKQSKEAMEKSTLQLYQVTTARNGVKDTTFISGTFSNDLGYFTFNSVKKGNYLLKVSGKLSIKSILFRLSGIISIVDEGKWCSSVVGGYCLGTRCYSDRRGGSYGECA